MIKTIKGTANKPRVSVSRSNKFVTLQFINDEKGVTLLAGTTKKIEAGKTSVEKALNLGTEIGKLAISKKIKEVVFDRNGYRYHGQVKAAAEGLRAAGIKL